MGIVNAFIDTNVLLYAYDPKEPEKQKRALEYLKPIFEQNFVASISVQVLQEFTHQLLRKGFKLHTIKEAVRPLFYWNVVENNINLYVEALDILERYRISLWDSLIIAAANQSGAKRLLSEDLNDGQRYGNVMAVNPFK